MRFELWIMLLILAVYAVVDEVWLLRKDLQRMQLFVQVNPPTKAWEREGEGEGGTAVD